MKFYTPITIDHARIARVLEAGCVHGRTGDAALVKRRLAGGSFQIWIQCLTCGRHLGSALSQAVHRDWRDYPDSDPSIAAGFYASVNRGPTLALKAGRILGMDLFAGGEIPAMRDALKLRSAPLEDIGFHVAAHLLAVDHIWPLYQRGYSAIGFLGEGKPAPDGIAPAAEMGIDAFLLPNGFAALVQENGHPTFMAATASAILAAVQPRQSTEEKADSLFQLKGARA
jgi:hypothetical protein